MNSKDIVARVYRETVASYGAQGIGRAEAVESAVATLMVEHAAGRIQIDVESALRSQLHKADESDGRAADRVIERAAYGETALSGLDMDLIVTLGAGRRKAWRDVTVEDLDVMVMVRFDNARLVRSAARDFNKSVTRIRGVVERHGTVGGAFDAGEFPPADLLSAAA